MKILLVTRWFSINANDSVMVHDLAYALRDAGHDVRVLVTEWKGQEPTGTYEVDGIPVWWYQQKAPGWLPNSLKTPYKMARCATQARRRFGQQIDEFAPDAVVMMSFTAFYTALISRFKKRKEVRLSLLLWDFFPYHHFSIRGIRNTLFMRIMVWLESRQLRRFDIIGLMTPRNLQYFRQAYPNVKTPKLVITPIWGRSSKPLPDKKALRKKFNLPANKVIAVFGGTLSAGRGIPELLELVRECQKDNSQAFFIIIGDGPLRADVEAYIKEHNLTNIICPRRLERNIYQNFIAACDIGIVSTTSNMKLIAPFPSKSIDYFRNQLPILASVETTTDYGEILEQEICGGLASVSGDLKKFKSNLMRLVESESLRNELASNGKLYFEKNLLAEKIASQIVNQLRDSA